MGALRLDSKKLIPPPEQGYVLTKAPMTMSCKVLGKVETPNGCYPRINVFTKTRQMRNYIKKNNERE